MEILSIQSGFHRLQNAPNRILKCLAMLTQSHILICIASQKGQNVNEIQVTSMCQETR